MPSGSIRATPTSFVGRNRFAPAPRSGGPRSRGAQDVIEVRLAREARDRDGLDRRLQKWPTKEELATLQPVDSWFTEGFDTHDLKQARVVLDRLEQHRSTAS